jgi:hypothetical protein
LLNSNPDRTNRQDKQTRQTNRQTDSAYLYYHLSRISVQFWGRTEGGSHHRWTSLEIAVTCQNSAPIPGRADGEMGERWGRERVRAGGEVEDQVRKKKGEMIREDRRRGEERRGEVECKEKTEEEERRTKKRDRMKEEEEGKQERQKKSNSRRGNRNGTKDSRNIQHQEVCLAD